MLFRDWERLRGGILRLGTVQFMSILGPEQGVKYGQYRLYRQRLKSVSGLE